MNAGDEPKNDNKTQENKLQNPFFFSTLQCFVTLSVNKWIKTFDNLKDTSVFLCMCLMTGKWTRFSAPLEPQLQSFYGNCCGSCAGKHECGRSQAERREHAEH